MCLSATEWVLTQLRNDLLNAHSAPLHELLHLVQAGAVWELWLIQSGSQRDTQAVRQARPSRAS